MTGMALAIPGAGSIAQVQDTLPQDSLRPVELPPLEITVARTPAALNTLPYAVSAVERSDIIRGRATLGLSEALVLVPGLVASNRYNPTLDERISIRGFGSRSAFGVRGVKVLLDGIPQTLPDGQGQLTNVELGNVSRVEVIRGSSSALYGNASGGVISLTTAAPTYSQFFPTVRITAGAFGLVKWQTVVSGPVGRGDLSIGLSETLSDGFRDHSGFDFRRISLRSRQAISAQTDLTLVVHAADNPEADNPGSLTRAQLDSAPAQADSRNVFPPVDAGKDVSQVQAGISARHRFTGGGQLEAAVFALRRNLENPLSFAFIDLDRWAYGLRTAVTVPTFLARVNQLLTVGVDAQWQRDTRLNLSPDSTSRRLDQTEHVSEIGPFVQLAFEPADKLHVTVGARYDRVAFSADDRLLSDGNDSGERIMSSLSGTVGVAVTLNDLVQPYASFGSSFESPTTTELVNRPEGGGGFNSDLEPQKATNFEVGVRGWVIELLSYSAAAFRVNVRDELISFQSTEQPGRDFFRNAGSGRRHGVELQASFGPLAGLSTDVAFSYNDFEFLEYRTETDVFDGNELPGVPRSFLYWSVSYDGPGHLWGAIDNTYSSAYYVDDANTTENDAWYVTSVRTGWRGQLSGWDLAPFVGVVNLFDQSYVGSVVINARGGRYFESAPGRNAYVGLEIKPAAAR